MSGGWRDVGRRSTDTLVSMRSRLQVDRIELFVRHELSELEAHEIASLLATFRPWFDAYRRVLGEISD